MRATQLKALEHIAERFETIEFVVGGSAMVSMLGPDIEVGDIDLLVPDHCRREVEDAAGEWWRGERQADPHPHLASAWVAALEVEGEAVEVMGGLAIISGGVRWELPTAGGPMVRVGKAAVPVARPGPWVILYAVYRPDRAVELARLVLEEEQLRTLAEVPPGLGIQWPSGNVVA